MPLPIYNDFLQALQAGITAEQWDNPLIGFVARGYCQLAPSPTQLAFPRGWVIGLESGGVLPWRTSEALAKILNNIPSAF